MRANDQYMASLSLKSASAMFASPPAVAGPSKPRNRPKPRVLRDRNGYILTQPEPGKKHILACIEIPPDRRVQRLIAEGAYKDYTLLGRGEARRWRFGDGTGVLAEGEEPGEVDGVSDTFRWRPWDESESEDEPEDSPKVVPPTPEPREKKPKVHYSVCAPSLGCVLISGTEWCDLSSMQAQVGQGEDAVSQPRVRPRILHNLLFALRL
jgi:hypothetical protein